VGQVELNLRSGKFEVIIHTSFGYGKTVQKAVDEAGDLRSMEDIQSAVRRGYAQHLKVLKRLKVVEREERPKPISIPMGDRTSH
jgi:hypothetical protein